MACVQLIEPSKTSEKKQPVKSFPLPNRVKVRSVCFFVFEADSQTKEKVHEVKYCAVLSLKKFPGILLYLSNYFQIIIACSAHTECHLSAHNKVTAL